MGEIVRTKCGVRIVLTHGNDCEGCRALLEESRPKVLWEGETREAIEPGYSLISPDPWPVPPGSRVQVSLIEETE